MPGPELDNIESTSETMTDEILLTPQVREVTATRFVLPLREGGSVPGLCEADDDGLYVVKFHAAAQGPKTLTAELIAGEIGRKLGLRVPELVLVNLPIELSIGEPDPEIQELLARSEGLNLGLDFLPGALPYDPATKAPVDPVLAADIVWFDAFIANVDRTVRNPNLLRWHDDLWLIDHGAAIYPHHRWQDPTAQGRRSFAAIKDHVLLPMAGSLVDADARMSARLDESALWSVIGGVPDIWLPDNEEIGSALQQREAYMTFFTSRLEGPRPFIEEGERCRAAADLGAIDPNRATRGRRRE